MHELPRKWTALPATQPRLLLPSLARLGDLLRGFQRFEFYFLRIEQRRLIVRAAENAAIPGRWPAMGQSWTATRDGPTPTPPLVRRLFNRITTAAVERLPSYGMGWPTPRGTCPGHPLNWLLTWVRNMLGSKSRGGSEFADLLEDWSAACSVPPHLPIDSIAGAGDMRTIDNLRLSSAQLLRLQPTCSESFIS